MSAADLTPVRLTRAQFAALPVRGLAMVVPTPDTPARYRCPRCPEPTVVEYAWRASGHSMIRYRRVEFEDASEPA